MKNSILLEEGNYQYSRLLKKNMKKLMKHLIFSIVLDTYSLEKALRSEGFEVLNLGSKKLLVKW